MSTKKNLRLTFTWDHGVDRECTISMSKDPTPETINEKLQEIMSHDTAAIVDEDGNVLMIVAHGLRCVRAEVVAPRFKGFASAAIPLVVKQQEDELGTIG